MADSNNEQSTTKSNFKKFDAYANIACGAILPIWAWSKRPMDFRDLSDAGAIALQGGWMLKPVFFYGLLALSVVALLYGIRKLKSL